MSKKLGFRISGPLPAGKFEFKCICENMIFEKVEEGDSARTFKCSKCGTEIRVQDQKATITYLLLLMK